MGTATRILLTGGTGYIGSRFLADAGPGYEIRAGIRPGSTLASSSATPVVLDEHTDLAPLLSDTDVFIHAAGLIPQAHPTDEEYAAINRDWTARIGEACRAHGVKLIFLSTEMVYADARGALRTEDEAEDSAHIDNPYARSKREAEEALRGGKTTVLRLGSVFGCSPAAIPDTRVNKFVREAVTGSPIRVFKDVWDEKRPYTYIGDVAAALRFVIEHDVFSGEAYNVLTENATTREVLTRIQECLPESRIEEVEGMAPPRSLGFDDARFRAFGFAPQGSLRAGIEELAQAFRKRT